MTSDGLVTASYAADETLLEALRGQWPPGPSPLHATSERGYVAPDLAGRPPVAALPLLRARFAVALVPEGDGWLSLPLAGFGGRWWMAAPGDGLSAFVAGVPAASERPLGVDQTNETVVVGERVAVKWFRRLGPGPSRAARLLAHLDAVGFPAIPQPLGSVTWRSPEGEERALAQGDAWLRDARDGWDWAVERLERGTPSAAVTGRQLGALVAGLHAALATPSPAIADPIAVAPDGTASRWQTAALATLDGAVASTDGPDGEALRAIEPSMRATLAELDGGGLVRIQPVHGDLHVGQVLEWSGGLAVIDFDGNPALGAEANALRQPVERDVAQMLTSLDHVGRIVERRRAAGPDPAVAEWILVARDAFLAAYGPVDPDRLAAFETEQELRELVYAARFLPRWRCADGDAPGPVRLGPHGRATISPMNPLHFIADLEAKPLWLGLLADRFAAGNPFSAVPRDVDRVLLFGMGSSRYAASGAARDLRVAGLSAVAEPASVDASWPPDPRTLVVAISATGESAETLDSVERYRGRSPIVAITNVPGSRLAGEADVVVEMGAGDEAGGVACRTFLHTGLLLRALEGHLTQFQEDLTGLTRRVADATAELLHPRTDWLPAVTRELGSPNGVFVLAPIERYASAEQGALMLREGPRVQAMACETGDWTHVDVYLTKTLDYRAILFPGSRWDRGALHWLNERRSTVVAVGPIASDAGTVTRTIRYTGDDDHDVARYTEILIPELLAAAWWRAQATA